MTNVEHLSESQRKAKLREIAILIRAAEKKLSRMYLIREKIETLEAGILYHSDELKMLKKLNTVAKHEATIICDL